MQVPDSALEQAYIQAQDLVRSADPDRYFATLFASSASRKHLFALYAFNIEIARVRELISEPLPGEVRLQWWRDAIKEPEGNEVEPASHPVAQALNATIIANNLPRQPFLDLLDARVFDLYDDLMPGWGELEGYCGETCSALFRLACLILWKQANTGNTGNSDPGAAEACGYAGVAYAYAGLLRSLPWHSRRGQVYLPQEALTPYNLSRTDFVQCRESPELMKVLGQMRSKAWEHMAHTHSLAPHIAEILKPAFLPLAMVGPYLKRMGTAKYKPFTSAIDVPNWKRIWYMATFKL